MKKNILLNLLLFFGLILAGCSITNSPTGEVTPTSDSTQPENSTQSTNTATTAETPTAENQAGEPDPTTAQTAAATGTESLEIDQPAEQFTFAVIGDYGLAGQQEADVASLVKSWNPEFIITVGDNNYPDGKAETIDENIGQYYAEYIYPYQGEYGTGAETNRFYPTLGNHDLNTSNGQAYFDYFQLPNNERYYDFTWGPVHFFALNSDSREPDGVGRSSTQAQWLQTKMSASTLPWQVVYFHTPPYSSAMHSSTEWMRWPFAEWGADVVLTGHDHVYERLEINGISYITNGLGGGAIYGFEDILPESQVRFNNDWGAMRVQVNENEMTFEFITRTNQVVDTYSISSSQDMSSTQQDVTTFPDFENYSWVNIASGLDRPLEVIGAQDGSGRLFILEQPGRIRVFQDGEMLSQPFLDIDDRVVNLRRYDERGLLGMAFDPNYSDNGIFYVHYSDNNGDTVVSSFMVTDDPNRADSNSEQVIFTLSQPYGNHNGGHIEFGPDGYLYIGLGDGGSGGDPDSNGQNLKTLLGSLIRVDVTRDEYTVPANNLYVDQDARPEIWAYGLRNPWKFHFDTQTAELYIADVGQNEWEEINYVPGDTSGGLNFGWDYFEGTHPFEGDPPAGMDFVEPVAEYDHSEGCSVTGGVVYRGPMTEWTGVYFYSDYCSGRIWGLLQDANGNWENKMLTNLGLPVTSFGYDGDGNVYFVEHGGGLYQLTSD